MAISLTQRINALREQFPDTGTLALRNMAQEQIAREGLSPDQAADVAAAGTGRFSDGPNQQQLLTQFAQQNQTSGAKTEQDAFFASPDTQAIISNFKANPNDRNAWRTLASHLFQAPINREDPSGGASDFTPTGLNQQLPEFNAFFDVVNRDPQLAQLMGDAQKKFDPDIFNANPAGQGLAIGALALGTAGLGALGGSATGAGSLPGVAMPAGIGPSGLSLAAGSAPGISAPVAGSIASTATAPSAFGSIPGSLPSVGSGGLGAKTAGALGSAVSGVGGIDGLLKAGAGIVGSVIAGQIGSKAIGDASNAENQAALAGVDENRRQFDAFMANIQPFIGTGTQAVGAQGDLLGLSGDPAQASAIGNLEQSPLFQALARQGEDAILQNASATGGLRGGNVQGALAQFRPQLLNQQIQQRFTNLGGLSAMGGNAAVGAGNAGINSAGNISNLLTNAGRAQSGGILGQANVQGQTASQIANTIGGLF